MRDSLYQQVYDRIREQIRNHDYPVGERLPSEAELLAEHEVSTITLKRALDLLRDEGYIDRKPRRGTFVVSDVPTTGASETPKPLIGCIVTNFDDTFGSHIIGALLDTETPANVVLKRSLGDPVVEERLIRELVASGVQGLILEPSSSEFAPPAIFELIMRAFPLAILDRVFEGVPVSSVCSDNVGAAKTAAEYLITLGHTRLGLVTSSSKVSAAEDRREGFVHAHAAAHIPHRPEAEYRLMESTVPGSDVPAEQDVAALRVFLSEHPELTAFVATEHNIAVLLRAALEQEGRTVPGDASIVSFDQPDTFYAPASFHFSSIRQQQAAMGAEALRLVVDQLAGPVPVQKVSLTTELVLGESTAPRRDP
ncbi:GntR family transcriptional regulator [Leifsonia poae]|uniref:LacI family transcriptional regulator n=1 Tax=Leifsonia poae TaxID=110933 RepID=A0A9W6LZ63_9MICO|nr:GntR family transcriptional regulator [Leifsonia poae]GLJ75317.1 LacI family transcriptional regulator [Leifsonia poae]